MSIFLCRSFLKYFFKIHMITFIKMYLSIYFQLLPKNMNSYNLKRLDIVDVDKHMLFWTNNLLHINITPFWNNKYIIPSLVTHVTSDAISKS